MAVDGLQPQGSTNFMDAWKKAFELMSSSRNAENLNVDLGCNTAYLFLTDGEPTFQGDDNIQTVVGTCRAYQNPRSTRATAPSQVCHFSQVCDLSISERISTRNHSNYHALKNVIVKNI